MRYDGREARLYGVGLQRGALFSILDAAWPGRAGALHAGCDIVDVDADNGLLHDACGQTHGPFDLVVVAAGAASRLRAGITAPRVDRPRSEARRVGTERVSACRSRWVRCHS